MAIMGSKTWLKHGALDYYECVGDDLHNNMGQTFPVMCKLKSDETAIFAFIVYKSKAHRNQVNKKVYRELMKMDPKKMVMPFDMKRFSMGGFKVLVQGK